MSDDLPDEFDLVVIGTGKNSRLLCVIFIDDSSNTTL